MLRDQGAGIEVDGGPGPGLEKRGLRRVKWIRDPGRAAPRAWWH